MRFLRKSSPSKTIIVISDIHLGAGAFVKSKRNFLEDFHYDKELVDFLKYYSSGVYQNSDVELVINGDLFDFLAVPYVEYFDDEFWSEEAALDKLKLIIDGHKEVIDELIKFTTLKNKKITYIIGNHDAELVLPKVREHFLSLIPEEGKKCFSFILEDEGIYKPLPSIMIKHGHEYEIAHQFDLKKSVVEDENGRKYFIPPWGSYYVTRVINKFKEERGYINAVRPIRKFLINGLIYDTLFTMRFMFQNAYYFIMVRFLFIFMQIKSVRTAIDYAKKELELFTNFDDLTEQFFHENEDIKALIVGHTHDAIYRTNSRGNIFINTGTWTDMHHLDFGKSHEGSLLTYAKIHKYDDKEDPYIFLNVWKGKSDLPYTEYSLTY
jgi:UDP-2,3-diacylglucosamine pyrophosphatase LpxH